MNILILTTFPFPIGLSGTNRLLSYAKGLSELGNDINILILRPTEKKGNIVNEKRKGIYGNINFEYSFLKTTKPKLKLFKIVIYIISFLYSFIIFIKYNLKKKTNIIISTCDSGIINLTYFTLSKIFRNKFIYFADEYPYPLRYNINPNKIQIMYFKIWVKVFDGIVVMTKNLYNYFQNYKKKTTKLFLMPMTVDHTRFNIVESNTNINGDYICYIGELSYNKDGVKNLIEAFNYLIKHNNYNIKLCIIGDAKDYNELLSLKSYCKKLYIDNLVIFTGRIPSDKVPIYLCNAKLLALARPDSIRSQGGFPTKLGEYLATGKPVVVTKVGEIPDYLSDGVNAYLCEPDNPIEFANKMKEILDNYENALLVGQKGKEVALNIFNYKIQSKNLNDFFVNILKK